MAPPNSRKPWRLRGRVHAAREQKGEAARAFAEVRDDFLKKRLTPPRLFLIQREPDGDAIFCGFGLTDFGLILRTTPPTEREGGFGSVFCASDFGLGADLTGIRAEKRDWVLVFGSGLCPTHRLLILNPLGSNAV